MDAEVQKLLEKFKEGLTLDGRKKIFEVHTKNVPLAKEVSVVEMARLTDGFVGADIESLVREAALNALRNDSNSKVVTRADFDEAFRRVKPSVSVETAQRYRKIEDFYLKKARAGVEVGPVYTG